MAGNQIQFDVKMNVDKTSLNSLEKSLSSIMKMTNTEYKSLSKSMGLERTDKDLTEIKRTINEVQLALKNSFNVDLGSTNIAKFNAQLKTMDVNKLRTAFTETGAAGRIAFRNLASEINKTKLQLKESHSLLNSMGDTLGRTIKWSISSSVINSFTGSIQKAFSYTERLDKSLNNIRIVSGESAENMVSFAKKANDAAQALGTTTTAYTDAALIYYQQGLKGTDVTERTDATIKMANVLGESADKVSSYMTAIWNNFDDGSQSLEHYSDVIAALGASTASSSEEIATGLEKFAAVADTAGLSYEYATSALATVVATTRQSADTVGTAFKTIFARIQGLNLGETLDDGTTLNKYSEALNKVGISIKQQNGEIKDMDNILDEMGAKWQTLSKDQQLALAQTVAGTRQYNQLLSLMDNWDFMKENLQTAADSTGTLNKQQETYMDSIESHMKSFKAAQENLYSSFIDTDSFKDLIDIFTKLTNGVANFTKGIGGGGNALLALGSIGTQVFRNNITKEIMSSINNFQALEYNSEQVKAQIESMSGLEIMTSNQDAIDEMVDLKTKALELKDVLSTAQKEEIDNVISRKLALENEKDAWNLKIESVEKYMNSIMGLKGEEKISIGGIENLGDFFDQTDTIEKFNNKLADLKLQSEGVSKSIEGLVRAQRDFNDNQAKATQNENLIIDSKSMVKNIEYTLKAFEKIEGQGFIAKETVKNLKNEFNNIDAEDGAALNNLAEKLIKIKDESDSTREKFEELLNVLQTKGIKAAIELGKKLGLTEEQLKNLQKQVDSTFAVKGLTQLISGVGQLTAGIRSLTNIVNILSDDSISAGEKTLQLMSAISMGFPMLINGGMQTAKGFKKIHAWLLVTAGAEDIVGKKAVIMWAKFLAPIAIIAAALFGLYKILKKTFDAYNEEEEAAKKAAEAAIETRKALDDAAAAAQALKDSISNYDEAIDNLKNLTKGTIEYEEALLKANEAALKLIENSKGDLKYGIDYSYNEDGLIEFEEGAQEKARENAIRREKDAFSANAQAQAKAQTTQVEADKMKIAQQDDLSFDSSSITGAGEAITGVAAGLVVGAMVPVIGPIVGALIGGVIGSMVGTINATDRKNDAQVKELNKITEAYHHYGEQIFNDVKKMKELGIEDASREYIESLREMCQANEEATAAQKESARQSAINAFETSEYYQSLLAQAEDGNVDAQREKDAIIEMGSLQYQDAYNEEYNNRIGEDIKDNFQEYAKAKGIQVTSFEEAKDGLIEYIDATSGESVKVTREMIASSLAAAKVNDELSKSASELGEAFNSLNSTFGEGADTMKKILSGDTDSMTKEEAEKWQQDVSKYDSMYDYIEQNFSKEQINSFGGEEALYEKLRPMYVQISDGLFENLPEAVGEKAKEIWKDNTFSEGLTKGAIDTLSLSFQAAYETAGVDGAKKIKNIYEKMGKAGVQSLTDSLRGIDWSQEDLKNFTERLSDIPEAANLSSKQIKILYNSLKDTSYLDSAVENLSSVLDKAKELKVGDIIDKTTWDNQFAMYGDSINEYFTVMSDGTRKLTKDAIQFYAALETASFNAATESIQKKLNTIELKKNEIDELQEKIDDKEYVTTKKPMGYDMILDMMEIRGVGAKDMEQTLNNPQSILDNWREDILYNGIGALDDLKKFNDEYHIIQNPDIIDNLNKSGVHSTADISSANALRADLEDAFKDFYLGDNDGDAGAGFSNKYAEYYAYSNDKDVAALDSARNELNTLSLSVIPDVEKTINAATSTAQLEQIDKDLLSQIQLKPVDMENRAYMATVEENAITGEDLVSAKAMELHEAERSANLDPEAVNQYAESLQNLTASEENARIGNEKLSSDLKDNKEAAIAVAEDVSLMNTGINKLANGFDDWSDVLKTSTAGSQEYSEAMGEMKDAVSNVLNVSKDSLSDSFITDNLKDIELAAKGDADAIDRLADSFGQSFIMDLKIEDKDVEAEVLDLHNELMDKMPDIKMGAVLEDGDFLDAAQKLVETSEMTADEANEYFKGIGFTPKFETTSVEQDGYNTKTYTEGVVVDQVKYEGPNGEDLSYPYIKESVTKTEQIPGKVKVQVPLINKKHPLQLTKSRAGSANNYSSNNPGGKAPGTKNDTGSKGKKSTLSKKKKKITRNKDIDVYRDINKEIGKIGDQLDKIQKKQDELIGTKLLENLKEQTAELEKQNKLSAKKAAIAVQEADRLKKKIDKDKNTKIKYDNDGNIINYNQALKDKYDWSQEPNKKYNKLLAEYKKLSKSEKIEQKDKYDKQLSKLEEQASSRKTSYDNFKSYLDEYEKALEIIPEMKKAIRENLEQEIELTIKEAKVEIEIQIDVNAFKQEWNRFNDKVIKGLKEDNPLDLEEMTQTNFNDMEIEEDNIAAYTKQNEKLLKWKDKADKGEETPYSKRDKKTGTWVFDEAAWLEDWKENNSNLQKSMENLVDLQDKVSQAQVTALENVAKGYSDIETAIDNINSHNEHTIKLNQLLYGEDAYDKMEKYYSRRTELAKEQLDLSQEQILYWEQQLKNAEESGNEKLIETAKENLAAAIEAFDGNLEAVAEAIRQEFELSIKKIITETGKAFASLGGYADMEYLKKDWALNEKIGDKYLDEVDRKYAVANLSSNFKDAINSASTLGAQQKITSLMNEQLNILEKKDKLSQYEVDRTQKLLDLELKRIALEEAQENKTALKLKRDAQGNYSYQYSADKSEVDKAQSDFDEGKKDYYDFVKKAARDNANNFISVEDEMQKELSALAEEDLSEEEFKKRAEEISVKYTKLLQGSAEQAQIGLQDLKTFLAKEEGMSEEEIEEYMKKNIPNYESISKILNGDIAGNIIKEVENLGITYADYQKAREELDKKRNGEEEKTINLQDKIKVSAEKALKPLKDEKNAVDKLNKSVKTFIKNSEAWQKAQKAVNKNAKKYAGFYLDVKDKTNETGLNSQKDYEDEKELNKKFDKGEYVVVEAGTQFYTGKGLKKKGTKTKKEIENAVVEEVTKGAIKIKGLGWISIANAKKHMSAFDTGGYTGDWNSAKGRLALLHQKELVLNKDDTRNVLDTVKTMRSISISGVLDKFSQIFNTLSSEASSLNTEQKSQDINQNVTIKADFPNVKDSKEIEQALSSLTTRAMQYAWSKEIDKK